MNDLATIARALRAQADAHLLAPGDIQSLKHERETTLEHHGQTLALCLHRLSLDPDMGLSVYVLFIRAVHGRLPGRLCDEVCRAVYDVEWKEGPLRPEWMSPLDLRWFMRVRKEDSASLSA